MANFNPNDIGVANGSYFGLPYSVDESEIVILPIPWDVTTSYKSGTSNGPKAILDASLQVDLFDVNVPFAWKVKIATLPVRDDIIDQNVVGREISSSVIKCLEMGYSQQELSKDISKRSMENYRFAMLMSPIYSKFKKAQLRFMDAKTHRYIKCPNCRTKLRVPKHKGKIIITCPKCKTEFTKRT